MHNLSASQDAHPLVVNLPKETAVIDSTSLLELLNKLIWMEEVRVNVCNIHRVGFSVILFNFSRIYSC